jgi:hypothetical protein
MRRRGQVPDISPEDLPLAKIGRGLLAEKATDVSSKTGRKLRSGTLAWWKRIVEPWNEEFGDVPVSMLRRAKVKEVLTVLASSAVPEANNDSMLRHAESLGCTIDHSILTLKEFPHTPRVRVALSAFELEFLVLRAPEHGRRMLLFKGTVGNRWSELATWVDARFDAEAQTMFVPAGSARRRRTRRSTSPLRRCSSSANSSLPAPQDPGASSRPRRV